MSTSQSRIRLINLGSTQLRENKFLFETGSNPLEYIVKVLPSDLPSQELDVLRQMRHLLTWRKETHGVLLPEEDVLLRELDECLLGEYATIHWNGQVDITHLDGTVNKYVDDVVSSLSAKPVLRVHPLKNYMGLYVFTNNEGIKWIEPEEVQGHLIGLGKTIWNTQKVIRDSREFFDYSLAEEGMLHPAIQEQRFVNSCLDVIYAVRRSICMADVTIYNFKGEPLPFPTRQYAESLSRDAARVIKEADAVSASAACWQQHLGRSGI